MTALLDDSVRELWHSEARAGRPPDPRLVAEEQYGLVVNWHHDDAFLKLPSLVDPNSPKKTLACREASRGSGKSTMVQFHRLYMAEFILPNMVRKGLPIRPENRNYLIMGRDQTHIRDEMLSPLKSLIINHAPWLRTPDWKGIIEDPDSPSEEGLRELSEMKSVGTMKWESLRIDLVNGVSFRTRTHRQSVRSLHVFAGDMDDPLTEQNVHESTEIKANIQGAILPALEPGGLFLLDGTPQGPSDLFSQCRDDPDWSYMAHPAIDMDRSRNYAQRNRDWLGDSIFNSLPAADHTCLWPARLSAAALEQARGKTIESEVKFQREYLLEREVESASLVRHEDLMAARNHALSYQQRARPGQDNSGGCDPSGRKKDAAGFVVGYVRPDAVRIPTHIGKLDVAPHLQDGEGELSVVQELNDLCNRFQCYRWFVEGNGAQAVLLPLARQMNSSIRPEKFMLGANKHTENGWLGLRTIFRNRLVQLPYKTDADKRITDEFIFQVRGLQFIDGKIVEDRRRKNDLASAFFLWLKSCEQSAAVYEATALVARKSVDTEAVASTIALPGTSPTQSLFDRPRHGGELSPNSPREQSLFDRMYRHTRR